MSKLKETIETVVELQVRFDTLTKAVEDLSRRIEDIEKRVPAAS